MANRLDITPMHFWHIAKRANMADFAGFNMPLWYDTGVKGEHLAVLRSAGLFDTSHMACIRVKGTDASKLLNYCFTRDLDFLQPWRCTYGAFLDKKGFCIDDAVIYRFDLTNFMVCVNAGMGPTISNHLEENKNRLNAEITDLSGKTAKIDIQGPNSAKILYSILNNADTIFKEFPYFSFKGDFDSNENEFESVTLKNNTPILLSRSGYTGEFGFEIFLEPSKALHLWEDIFEVGNSFGITACGLGSRDSLRTGAGLPLSHQDIGKFVFKNHPWEFALPYNKEKTGFTKSFIGRQALMEGKNSSFTLLFIGDSLRKIHPGDSSRVLDRSGKDIGWVLSCATDMAIDYLDDKIVSINSPGLPDNFKIKGLSCGFIQANEKLKPGTVITLKEKKREIKARIVKTIRPDLTARKKLNYFI